jgi:hypothetical protein
VKRRDGTVQCVSPERGRERATTTLHLLDGGPQTLQRGIDLWPGGEWSGPHRDLLPSELASVRRWIDHPNEAAIGQLAFGKDFGVPLRGALGSVGSDHVVSEFKWLRAVEKDKSALAQPPIVQALQARFLEGAMLMTAASLLAEEEASPRTVNVNYSFPLAFDEGDLDTLRGATRRPASAEGPHRRRLLFPAPPLVDEAQAAAGHTPSDKMFRVYLDLGGGSLEVLVDDTLARNSQQGHAGMHPHVFSTSIFFGGSVYLRSLVGAARATAGLVRDARHGLVHPPRQRGAPEPLGQGPARVAARHRRDAQGHRRAPRAGLHRVHRRARGAGARGRVPGARAHRRRRARPLAQPPVYALRQGSARRWILGANKGPGQKRVVEFSLVLLGNGWGFGDIVRDGMKNVEQMMAQRVYARLMELLREHEDLARRSPTAS